MQRVAVISMHTSPLAQPGVGDGGGMNVYVRELVSAMAQTNQIQCTTYTRAWRPGLPKVVEVEPNHRIVHIEAGRFDLAKDELLDVVELFTQRVAEHIGESGGADVLHANYWLSGLVGHRLKHQLGLPLVTTFHTLARVKTLGGDTESVVRERAELEIIGCADAICVSCPEEESQFRELYGQSPGVLTVASPGVATAFFSPGDRRGARRALGWPDKPLMLFVGRIQPLKGVDIAVQTLAKIHDKRTQLMIVGGASGTFGSSESNHVRKLIFELGLESRVHFIDPQPHHLLSTYYRAADVVLVPSRSESFGLVALEAAACGVPVVASGVGGLLSLIEHGRTGYLVKNRNADSFALFTNKLLGDPLLSLTMGNRAADRAKNYSWAATAESVIGVYNALHSGQLVACT
ncbi:MAG: glycosyltransferase [Actinomycetota bacterium]|nr:glycosyltransferase [Actinomycetota bacterium]